ncbi:MAG: lysoplasmalogenase family protein [Burkholderiales bacterium]
MAQAFTVACLAAVAGLLLAERFARPVARAVCKLGASAAFVLVALSLDAAASGYGRWQVLLGAVLFAASDVAVARDRFVARGFRNKAWGSPAYYLAQLILAWSVASAA